MSELNITSKYDDEDCMLEIFVNGESAVEWYCEEHPDRMVDEFKKVLELGRNTRAIPEGRESLDTTRVMVQKEALRALTYSFDSRSKMEAMIAVGEVD